MRKKILSFIATMAILVSLLVPNIAMSHATESVEPIQTIDISTFADAHVNAGTNADKNFGRNSNMCVRSRVTPDKNYYEAYLKFKIPKYVGSVESATLALTFQTVPDNAVGRSYTVSTTETNWEEGTGNVNGEENEVIENRITYNTVPTAAPLNNSTTFTIAEPLPVRGDVIKFEIGDVLGTYLQEYSVENAPTEVSIKISSRATTSETDLLFRTKENVNGGAPTINLNYISNGTESKPVEIYTGLHYNEDEMDNSAGKNVDMFTLEMAADGPMEIVTGVPNNTVPLKAGSRQTPTEQAQAAQKDGENVIAAINADFFFIKDDSMIQPRGLVVKNGQLLNPMNDWYFFGIKKDGAPIIGDKTLYTEVKDDLKEAVGGDSGYLIKDGVAITANSQGGSHAANTVEPRTAVGIKADGAVMFVVADGRTTDSDGVALVDLAQYMLSKGVENAINLDGGGSSAMTVKNAETSNFETKNKPSDGHERAVGNTLLVVDSRIDDAVLSALIGAAKTTLNDAEFGMGNGNNAPEQETMLTAAITAAEKTLESATSQTEIIKACDDLQKVLNTFKDAVISVNYSPLKSLITSAHSVHDNATEGNTFGQYNAGSKATLLTTIQSAELVANKSNATQKEVDNAKNALLSALTLFEESKVPRPTFTLTINAPEQITNIKIDDSSVASNYIAGEYVLTFNVKSGYNAIVKIGDTVMTAVDDKYTVQISDSNVNITIAVEQEANKKGCASTLMSTPFIICLLLMIFITYKVISFRKKA